MKQSPGHRWMPVVVIGALVTTAVIVAGVRGSGQGAVLALLIGVLLIAYLVRHEVRARLMYDRHSVAPDRSGDRQADDRSRPAPVAGKTESRS